MLKIVQKSIIVGIDISLNNLDISVIDDNFNVYTNKSNRSYTNSPFGLNQFVKNLRGIIRETSTKIIIIGFEATGNYGFHLPYFFKSHDCLKDYQVEVYQINPKIIKHFRKALGDPPKTDKCDSLLIAERVKMGKLPLYTKYEPQYMALRTLTRQRFDMVMKLSSEKTRFISQLFIKASAFVQDCPFSQLTGATSASLMTEYNSSDDIALAPIEELTAFIIEKSKNKVKNAQKVAALVKSIARESFRIDRVLHDSVTVALMSSYRHIKFLNKELKHLEKEIERVIPAFINEYKILNSIKGIGPVFAAGIAAEIGDISVFKGHPQLAKYAGLIWRIKQSGKFKAEETSLTKAGNKYLRYYLCAAAQSLVTHNKNFKTYYARKFKEVSKHQHKRAVTLCARKLVRVIFYLLKQNKLYELPPSVEALSA